MELDSHPYRDRSLMSHFPQVRQNRRGGKACKYRCAECKRKRRVQAQAHSLQQGALLSRVFFPARLVGCGGSLSLCGEGMACGLIAPCHACGARSLYLCAYVWRVAVCLWLVLLAVGWTHCHRGCARVRA